MKLNNFEKRAFAVGLALSMVVTGSSADFGTAVAAKKPKLSKSKLTVTVGKTATLTVKNANKKVKWSTNKKKIAKVASKSGKKSEKAVIKGVKVGKAVITAKVGKKKIKCKITVKKQAPNFKSVSVDNFDRSCLVLKLKKKDTSMKVVDFSVVTKEQNAGAYNKKINVEKVVPVNGTQYRIYLQDAIPNGSYVQITSGNSKASSQFKAPFYAENDEVNYKIEKGTNIDKNFGSLFGNAIGSVKISTKSGKLPDGLAIDKKEYDVKGIATTAGTSQVTLQGVDEMGRKASVKVNFLVYDENTLAVGNDSYDIKWDKSMKENAAAQAAANETKLDMDKVADVNGGNYSRSYAAVYTINPVGGSGHYTFTLDTPDDANVRLSTDKVSDDAAKTVTKQNATSTELCIPYTISAGTHTYKVTAADVTDAQRTCTATITVKVIPYYNLNGVVKSSNGLAITGADVELIPSTAKQGEDIIETTSQSNYNGRGQCVGEYDVEVPAGTYTVKVAGDVAYEMTQKIKVAKADKSATISVPERFYAVSGKAAYSNSSNKLERKRVYFESLNNQYETESGNYSVDTNSTGSFNVALPANTYVAYVLDEKGNRKYMSSKITVTKDMSVGTLKANLTRYSVEGIAFNGTAIDAQTNFADKITDVTLKFYDEKGLCVAAPSTDSKGYYKVFLPGDKTYTVKAFFAGATRTMGTVTVAKENVKGANLTYNPATEIAGATAYAASPLAPESVLNSTGGNDVIWSFAPTQNGRYSFTATSAVNKGVELALFDANMQFIASGTTDSLQAAVVKTELKDVELEANKTYYIKALPTGVEGRDGYYSQAQGEVKLAIVMKQQAATPTPVPPVSGSAITQ